LLSGRGLLTAAALVGAVAIASPTPASAGVSPGAAVGIGLGSLALGTAIGSALSPIPTAITLTGIMPRRRPITRRRLRFIANRGRAGTRNTAATTPA